MIHSILAGLTALLFSSASFASFAEDQAAKSFEELVDVDLLLLQQQEAHGSSAGDIRRLNQETLQKLKDFKITPSKSRRIDAISLDFGDLLLFSINQHPVVSEYNLYDYRDGMSIGFCFGRATYVHLALLMAGVNKAAIKKVWAVGPMSTGDTDWQFHVATVVKGLNDQWLAIDSFTGEVLPVESWFKKMQAVAKDNTLRLYASEPRKFSVSLGEYSRVQLGLDLSKDQDWYTHYFKKLMTWTATKPLSDVGLYDLRK
jgi:hypothetical protein